MVLNFVSFQPHAAKGPAGCAPLRVSALGSREVPPDDRPGAQRAERSFPGAAVGTALQPRCRKGESFTVSAISDQLNQLLLFSKVVFFCVNTHELKGKI
jgi:hypothetical protein